MDIAISGASGLIGTALSTSLAADGHRPIALVRRDAKPGADEIAWDPSAKTIDAASLEGVDAIVHLAGAGIGDKRWTEERKQLLRSSRIDGTSLLATTAAQLTKPPATFICGSAIGYYGSRGDERLTETSMPGTGFLADLVVDWEAAAAPATAAGIRTVFARTGIVMSSDGGSLKKQLLLFKLGLGGRLGSGDQYLAWISIDDEVRALEHLLMNDISGTVNLTAPEPVTNLVFTKTLGDVLNRPTILPVPLIGPRLLFGKQMVEEALLASQRVIPQALLDAGFTFDHPDLTSCLKAEVG